MKGRENEGMRRRKKRKTNNKQSRILEHKREERLTGWRELERETRGRR